MNIVLFSDTFPPEVNGVATSVWTLYNVLKKNGHNVYVVTTNPYSKKLIREEDVIRIPGIKLKKLYGYIFARIYSRKTLKFLKDHDIDVIHINCDFSIGQFGWISQRMLKKPSVYTYHTMYEDYTYYATRGKIDRFAKWVVRDYFINLSYRSNELIVPSYKCKDYARRIGINSYINVIPTGINLDMFLNFKLKQEDKENFLKKYNIPLDSKIVLFLGRLASEKNVKELLDNFKAFIESKRDSKSYFVIVGDGPQRYELEDYAKKINISDRVRFVGKVSYENCPFYYSLADVFINASVSETQGLTYLEAMASKTIVLVKFDINLVELIKEGENGYLFQDKNEFIEKLWKILNFDTTYYSEVVNNSLKVIDKWGEEEFYRKVMWVYQKAIREFW